MTGARNDPPETFLEPEYGTSDVHPDVRSVERRAATLPEAYELLADTLGAEPLPFVWREWNVAREYNGRFDFGPMLRAHVYCLALPDSEVSSPGGLESHLSAYPKIARSIGLDGTPSRSTLRRFWKDLSDEQQEWLRNHAATVRRQVASTGAPASGTIAPEPTDDGEELKEVPVGEKKRAVEHLRAFCYEQLGFGRAENKSHHRDELLDLQAEVSRETGFVQGTIEDRWMDGEACHTPKAHFNAIQNHDVDHWRDRFDHVFEMQVQAAKNAGMFQRPVHIHIDGTVIPYYKRGQTDTDELPEGVTGNAKARGTHYGYKHVTVSAIDNHRSICLASFDITDRKQMGRAVKHVIRKAEKRVSIKSLSMDSEFAKADLIAWLKNRKIETTVQLPRRGKQLKRKLVQMTGHFEQDEFKFGKDSFYQPTTEGTIIVERDYDVDEPDGPEPGGGQESGNLSMFGGGVDHAEVDLDEIDDRWWKRWRPYFTTADVDEGDEEAHVRQYKQRWAIETKYRVIKDEFLGRTTAHDYTTRVYFWLFAVMMYNAWVLLDVFMRADFPDLVPEDRPTMPARTFAKQFFKVEYG